MNGRKPLPEPVVFKPTDDDIREQIETLENWGKELDETIAELRDQRTKLADAVWKLQSTLDNK